MRKLLLLLLLSPILSMCQPLSLAGKVVNEQGAPIEGATITLKRVVSPGTQPGIPASSTTIRHLLSGPNGEFTLSGLVLGDSIIASAVGFSPESIVYDQGLTRFPKLTVELKRKISVLDETVIIAYGTTTRRLSTGSISRVTAEEMARQPVANPLAALIGRVPGLVVTPSSGVPGGALKVEIRGRSSIAQSADPLFIIDGVPFAPGNDRINSLRSAASTPNNVFTGGLSPFSSINPADIESIEVLKDADATAIYGSRGAGGVVLITTKKGRGGRTLFNLAYTTGWSWAGAVPRLLATEQYLGLRRDAFAADGITPTAANAPDLLVYDTTRYTDFRKLLTGGTARSTNLQATVSGGTAATRFSLGAGYNRETTVYPGNLSDQRFSIRSALSHNSPDGRLSLSLTTYYATENNNLAAGDLTQYIAILPPNMPALLDGNGHPVWDYNGRSFTTNPLAYLATTTVANTDNLLANFTTSYHLARGLTARLNAGYNTLQLKESSLNPIKAQNPASAAVATADFAASTAKNWILEPQLEYTASLKNSRLIALLGGSWQQATTLGETVSASGFPNDALLGYLGAASTLAVRNNDIAYRYAAAFARLQYHYAGRYLLSLSGRRDGSSRFGPGRQYAGFGAVGGGWIFSAERFARAWERWLSFGKLRASYGTAGNDKIGDYQFLDTWQVTTYPYQGTATLRPTRLYNPDYNWEEVRKLNLGLDLGFCSDRWLLTVEWYRSRSGNQLISYKLPQLTGFSSIIQNFPALVQNTGWELSLTRQPKTGRRFDWEASFNIAFPKNTLLEFPGLETSSYVSLVIGQPLSILRGYHYTGIDSQAGLYTFADTNGDGVISSKDYQPIGYPDPVFLGGLSAGLHYGDWELQVFLDFKKQKGRNYTFYQESLVPGFAYNQPLPVFSYWQKPGLEAAVQVPTTVTTSAAYKAYNNFLASDGTLVDASYAKLRNLSLAWTLPGPWCKRVALQSGRLYLQAQNLLTFTRFPVADPEIQNTRVLPPLTTLAAGIQITL